VYELARAALEEQRELVAGLRSRAAPVLAGAGALAALLAEPAIGEGLSFTADPLHASLVVCGILGAVAALLGAILVPATRDFGFSVDADRLYRAAYADRGDPETYLIRLAESHRQRRVANLDGVRALQRFLLAASSGSPSRSPASRPRSPYTESMATTAQNAPKPAPVPAPQPPKVEPYPDICFVEGKAQGRPGERRSG